MAAGPQRRTVRLTHLDAHVVPVERALIARAEVLEQRSKELGDGDDQIYLVIAAEFRAMAEELHFR
jgi:hypothetical protein